MWMVSAQHSMRVPEGSRPLITAAGAATLGQTLDVVATDHNAWREHIFSLPSPSLKFVVCEAMKTERVRNNSEVHSRLLELIVTKARTDCELLTHQRVFPSKMSAAMIMRRALSTMPNDRPMIPSYYLHPVLRELITRSWNPAATKRATMDALWKRMQDVGFNIFPNVIVTIDPSPMSPDEFAPFLENFPSRIHLC
jgi:hypothetical protein